MLHQYLDASTRSKVKVYKTGVNAFSCRIVLIKYVNITHETIGTTGLAMKNYTTNNDNINTILISSINEADPDIRDLAMSYMMYKTGKYRYLLNIRTRNRAARKKDLIWVA